MLTPTAELVSVNGAWPASGVVTAEGGVIVNGNGYPSPSAAASAVKNGAASGWDFWAVVDGKERTTLATLRSEYVEAHPSADTPSREAPVQ